MSVYIVNFLQTLKKCLTMIRTVSLFTIEGHVIDIIYVGELEIHIVSVRVCVARPVAYCSVFGPYWKKFEHPCIKTFIQQLARY